MAIEVLLSTDELNVLGPPQSIELSVDIGPKGERGSHIYSGAGHPNDQTALDNIDLKIYDLYINTSSSEGFSWVYQYINTPSGDSWTPILKLSPTIYFDNISLSFNGSGVATTNILLSDISSGDAITDPNRYTVLLTPIGADPVAFSINSKTVTTGATPTLDLTIEAVKYNGSWSALAGTVTWGITISVV